MRLNSPKKARLPTIDPHREFVEAGALGIVGSKFQPATAAPPVAVEILKGTKPRDIPIFWRSITIFTSRNRWSQRAA
jgi:ABC-type uncharacterized transport system substrate-binding protein